MSLLRKFLLSSFLVFVATACSEPPPEPSGHSESKLEDDSDYGSDESDRGSTDDTDPPPSDDEYGPPAPPSTDDDPPPSPTKSCPPGYKPCGPRYCCPYYQP